METIEKIEQDIIDEFSVYDDWMDKYAYLIESDGYARHGGAI